MMQSHLLQTQSMTYRQRLPRVRSPLKALRWFFALLFISVPSGAFPGTFVGFGPQNYTRGTGDPVVVTNAFTVQNPNTTYTLQIYNGGLVDGEFEKVSSSVIAVNGVQIVGPNEFNQNVTFVEKPVTLAANNQLSVELRGKPGGGITIQIIGVDNDVPTITASADPPPNGAGWNNSSVMVGFTCSDMTSGIATCPNTVTATQEGANQVISATAVDRAGNTASTSVTLNIDKTTPTLSPTLTPQPNAAGWHKSDATVSFTCADSISGVASCPAPITVTTEGANQLISGTATDLAGNSASANVTVSLDKSAPTVAISSPANDSSVTSSPVNVTGTASDSLSGIATVFCNGSSATISASTFSCDVPLSNGPNTITVEATDVAANTGSSSITVTLGPAPEPQNFPSAQNTRGDLSGENWGDQIVFNWAYQDGATAYIVYRSTLASGPWQELGRMSDAVARTSGSKIDDTPDARLTDLCYKIEAIDANGVVIRFYQPMCVPKFVQ